jgi:hypothetical protein
VPILDPSVFADVVQRTLRISPETYHSWFAEKRLDLVLAAVAFGGRYAVLKVRARWRRRRLSAPTSVVEHRTRRDLQRERDRAKQPRLPL